MCGRFASARKRKELLEEFGVASDRTGDGLREDYNVAPTKAVYAVMTRHEGDHEADGHHPGGEKPGGREPDARPGDAERQLRVVRWGLVPFWAKDPKVGSRMINARAETVADKPAYRRAFAKRRCLMPADGFYEWQQREDAGGRRHKQPYFIHRGDGGVLAFAGLYELWRDRSVPDDHERAWLWTSTIITTTATDEVGQIHDRMPMIIEPSSWDDWLDPGRHDPAALHELLVVSGGLTSHPVSAMVNNVRNNGPELMARARSGPPDEGAGAGA